MYTVWNVTFRIKPDNRGPCDPLYRMEPLARGSVGDADPFAEAFGRALTLVEDSLPFRQTRSDQASSATSDISDLFSLQSSILDSPLTPDTTNSTFSQSDGCGSMGRHLPYQPVPPNLDYYAGKTKSSTRPPTWTDDLNCSQSTFGELTAKLEDQDDNPGPQAAIPSAIALSAFPSTAKPSTETKRRTKPCAKTKRKKKTPSMTTRRPPVKSREQHLSDNKAAASRCRQQRKAWEAHLQDVSLVLKSSIDVSKNEINELGSELADLKRQLWRCPDCTDQYIYSGGLDRSGTLLNPDHGTDTASARPDTLSAREGALHEYETCHVT